MKKIYFVLLFVFVILHKLYSASQKGTDTAVILRFNSSAEASAMGDCFVAIGDSIDSIFYNPAGLADLENIGISVNYTKWIFDMYDASLGFVFPLSKHRFGCVLRYFYIGEINEVVSPSQPTGDKILLYNTISSVVYVYKIKDKISSGVTLKNLIQNYGRNYNISSFVLDLSGKVNINNFLFGIVLANIGPAVKIDNVENTIPTMIKIGGGYKIKNFKAGMDFNILTTGDFKLSFGGEYVLTDIKLRFGYNQTDEFNILKGLSLGIGYETVSGGWGYVSSGTKQIKIAFNYSLSYLSEEFGFIHRIGIVAKF